MPTKEALSEELNEKLGTNIEWDRMKKEDLTHLNTMVEDGDLIEVLLKQVAKKQGAKKYEELVEEWSPGKLALRLL